MEILFWLVLIVLVIYVLRTRKYRIEYDFKRICPPPTLEPKKYYFPYRVRQSMMTISEKVLFDKLKLVIGDRFDIYPQVKLDKIFAVDQPRWNKYYVINFRRISQKSVDFLVVEKNKQAPLFAIELDDYTHENKDRRERDNFVGELFKTTNFPLIRFNPDDYKIEELKTIFDKYLN
jgi:hypothetical protein